MSVIRATNHQEGIQYVLLVNYLSDSSESFSLVQRELIRQIIFDSLAGLKVKLVSWVILPRSYRIIIKAKQEFVDGRLNPQSPMTLFARGFQQRISKVKLAVQPLKWSAPFKSTDIAKPKLLAAMVSIDAAPVWAGIAPSPDDYFFSSYYQAKFCDDTNAQEWIKNVTGKKTSWPDADKAYKKAMDTITSSL